MFHTSVAERLSNCRHIDGDSLMTKLFLRILIDLFFFIEAKVRFIIAFQSSDDFGERVIKCMLIRFYHYDLSSKAADKRSAVASENTVKFHIFDSRIYN